MTRPCSSGAVKRGQLWFSSRQPPCTRSPQRRDALKARFPHFAQIKPFAPLRIADEAHGIAGRRQIGKLKALGNRRPRRKEHTDPMNARFLPRADISVAVKGQRRRFFQRLKPAVFPPFASVGRAPDRLPARLQ